MSQAKQILRRLRKGYRITPLDALRDFNCFRLSGRILELRQAGHNIRTVMVVKGKKRVASYRLSQ